MGMMNGQEGHRMPYGKFFKPIVRYFCVQWDGGEFARPVQHMPLNHSILCHRLAHLETDECGAPEFFSNGSKVLRGGEGEQGKICPASIEEAVDAQDRPSLSQAQGGECHPVDRSGYDTALRNSN